MFRHENANLFTHSPILEFALAIGLENVHTEGNMHCP